MEEQPQFAGLGKLYFCRAEDFKKNPGTPMQEVKTTLKGHRIDLHDLPKHEEADETGGEGWKTTATFSIEPTPEMIRTWHRIMYGEGRLPRRKKKKCLNRVLNNRNVVGTLAGLLLICTNTARDYAAGKMFPEKVRRIDEVHKVVNINDAEHRLVLLCMKRVYRWMVKQIQKEERRTTKTQISNDPEPVRQLPLPSLRGDAVAHEAP